MAWENYLSSIYYDSSKLYRYEKKAWNLQHESIRKTTQYCHSHDFVVESGPFYFTMSFIAKNRPGIRWQHTHIRVWLTNEYVVSICHINYLLDSHASLDQLPWQQVGLADVKIPVWYYGL